MEGDGVGETFVSASVILGRARVQDADGGNWEILFEAIDRDPQLDFAANLWPTPVPNEIVTAGVEIPEVSLPGLESFAGLGDGSVDVRVGVNSDFTDLRLSITDDFTVAVFPGGPEHFNLWATTWDLSGMLRAVGV